MSGFNKRSSKNDLLKENSRADVFSDDDWNPEEFEREISMSLKEKKNASDEKSGEEQDERDEFSSDDFDLSKDFAGSFDSDESPLGDGADDPVFDDDFSDDSRSGGSDDAADDGFFSDDFGDSAPDDTEDDPDSEQASGDDAGADADEAAGSASEDSGDNAGSDGDSASDSSSGSAVEDPVAADTAVDSGKDAVSDGKEDGGEDDEEESSGSRIISRIAVVSVIFAAIAIMLVIIQRKDIDRQIRTAKPAVESATESASVTEASSETPATQPSDKNASSEDSASSADTTVSEAVSSEEETQHSYKTLKKGDKNENVLLMQNRLCELGYCTTDSCTGYYGDYTEKKVKRFQKAAGLEQTGTADKTTLERLYAKDAPRA